MNPKIGRHAQQGGFAKAAAAQAATRAAVRAALPEGGLPPLDSIEHAQERLAILSSLLIEVSPPGGNAAVRAVEVWLKAEAARLDRVRLKELEAQVRTLRAELGEARRTGRAVPALSEA